MAKRNKTFTLLKKLISHTHLAEKKGEITHNTKEKIISFYNSGNCFLKQLNTKDYLDHLSGEKTFFGQGAWLTKQTHTLCNIDIDCHKSGSLDGAIKFASWLKENHFKDLYWETSTSGNGIHCYIIIEKHGGREIVNDAITHLQGFLRQFTDQFDISGVETKGHLPIINFSNNKVTSIKSGSNFKLPRGEFSKTYMCSYKDLLELPVKVAKKPQKGSCCLIDEEGLEQAKIVAHNIMLPYKQQFSFTSIDLAQFIAILIWKTNNPNDDKSMPTELFRAITKALYQNGTFTRSWDCQRHKQMRDFLSASGYINWIDEKYIRPSNRQIKDGVCCKWEASVALQQCFEQHTHLATTEVKKKLFIVPICIGQASYLDWDEDRLTEFIRQAA